MIRRSLPFCILFFAAAFGGCKPKTETLSLLVWEGYADLLSSSRSSNLIIAKSLRRTWARATSLSPSFAAAARPITMSSRRRATSPLPSSARDWLRRSISRRFFLQSALRETSRFSPGERQRQIYGVPFVWGRILCSMTLPCFPSRRTPGASFGLQVQGQNLVVG